MDYLNEIKKICGLNSFKLINEFLSHSDDDYKTFKDKKHRWMISNYAMCHIEMVKKVYPIMLKHFMNLYNSSDGFTKEYYKSIIYNIISNYKKIGGVENE